MEREHHYEIVAEAIRFITANAKRQPSLEEVAAHVHLSSFYFQRLFSEWAGISPKKFLQFLTVEHAKSLLRSAKAGPTLFDTAEGSGLSGTGRLHDLFVNMEGMTPAEFRDGGKDLRITFDKGTCRFGHYIVAATNKGVCNILFSNDPAESAAALQMQWYNSTLVPDTGPHQQQVHRFLGDPQHFEGRINLHLKGSSFQLKVWAALLRIPSGSVTTYGRIADNLGNSGASRAVGTAVAANGIGYLIPCHRVIRNEGLFGNFRWGTERKMAMLAWESAAERPYQRLSVD